MNGELTLIAALTAGLMGSGHCLGMCGGIAGAVGMSGPRRNGAQGIAYSLLYNLGRIASYTTAGFLVGSLGTWLGDAFHIGPWAAVLRAITGLLMLGIGLQLALNWRGLRKIEALGGRLWKLISPLAHKLLPPRNPAQALGLGLVWGWLPCGLVYTMLAAAAVAGSGPHGAALMGAFGLGTLPAMVGATAAAHKLTAWSRKPALRRIAGATIFLFGVWTLVSPAKMVLMQHHQSVAYSAIGAANCPTGG